MDGDHRAVGPGQRDEQGEGDSLLAVDVPPPTEDSHEPSGTRGRATARPRFIPPADVAAGLGLLVMAVVVFVARGNNATGALLVTAGAGCLGVSWWYRRPERVSRAQHTSDLEIAREPVVAEPPPRTRETMQWRRLVPPLDLAAGMAIGVAALATYAAAGYSLVMFLLLLAAIVSLGASLRARRKAPMPRIPRLDLLVMFALVLAFAPLYLLSVHTVPVQVGSDEVAIMTFARQVANARHVDPFGLSTYFAFPTLIFLVFGKLGQLMGGVTLAHMRLLHGLFGLTEIAAAYALFRQLLPRRWAVFATCILGSSHPFFMISRLAMRDNTPVLVEVLALALLLRGLKHDEPFCTYLGGLVAGLGFYTYFPARAILVLWLLFLASLAILQRVTFTPRQLVRLGSVAVVGFIMTAGPVLIATAQAPPADQQFQKQALLLFPEGRQLQQQWVKAPNVAGGIRTNIVYGLTTFNNHIPDHGWIYVNWHHGFIDPLTGVLLWLGVASVVVRLVRHRDDPWPLLALGGFIAFWVAFAFLVNKAPNYTRLLITLPFVAYLVTIAVRTLGSGARKALRSWSPQVQAGAVGAVALGTIGAVLGWNLVIARDYVRLGQKWGDAIGGSGRYIESHRDVPGERFYLAADARFPFFDWSGPDMGTSRMQFFAHDGQVADVISPGALGAFHAAPPFAMFMNGALWARAKDQFGARYPQAHLQKITPNGALVAVVVSRPAPT